LNKPFLVIVMKSSNFKILSSVLDKPAEPKCRLNHCPIIHHRETLQYYSHPYNELLCEDWMEDLRQRVNVNYLTTVMNLQMSQNVFFLS